MSGAIRAAGSRAMPSIWGECFSCERCLQGSLTRRESGENWGVGLLGSSSAIGLAQRPSRDGMGVA
jgi:hypothetical protein